MKTHVFHTAKSVILFPLFFLFVISNYATHLVGVEIYQACISPCVHRITHKMYHDCTGAATPIPPNVPPAPNITFQGSPAGCNSFPLPIGQWVLMHYVEVTPICPGLLSGCSTTPSVINGVRESRYYRDYDLCFSAPSPCTSYALSWGSCCRNGAITSGAANQGIFINSTVIDLSVTPCNSSPQFLCDPIMYVCAGQSQQFSQRAYDPDGDSLAYKLVPCLSTQPSTAVSYALGYSATQPLGPDWLVSLDAVTGSVDLTPNPNGGPVVGVICIEVEEWRGGVKIGGVGRDVQAIVVTNCGTGNTSPQIDSVSLIQGGQQLAPTFFNMCQLDTIEILVHASDVDSLQSLIMNSSLVIPGLQVINNSFNPPTAIIRFAPNRFGEFDIPIKVSDDFCPIPGNDIENLHISVGGTCLTANVTGTACGQTNGAIDLMISAGFTPFTYLWSTGDTTEDISGLSTGNYTVTVTDSLGNAFVDSFFVNGTNISLNPTITQPTCANQTGSISLVPTGGIFPYYYSWNNGLTSSVITNQQPGTYRVTFTDLNGCARQEDFVLLPPDSCFNVISGVLYNDLNSNCVLDTNESVIPYGIIDLSPGGAVATDSNGRYSFQVDTGSYDVDIYPIPWKTIVCPVNGTHQVNFTNYRNTPQLDFAMYTDTIQELELQAYHFPFKVGLSGFLYFQVINNGSIPMNGSLTWVHDTMFNVQSFYPSSGSYNFINRTMTWSFVNLQPSRSLFFYINANLNGGGTLGAPYTNTAQVLPIVGDSIPGNNTVITQDSVRGPFDPNDKQVSPKGIGPLGYIEQSETQMSYTVRFQNTGTDTAYHVQIRDTIDVRVLDALSFRRQIESDPYRLQIEEDSILVFDFDNIKLPDSTTNFVESQGFVKFGMRHQGTLAPGSQIRNRAAIYFDTNAPIITNTVLNTIFAYPAVALGPDSICAGDSLHATLGQTGVPPFAILWSDGTSDLGNQSGNSQIGVHAAGTYQVRVQDAIGNEVVDSLAVRIAPEPNAAFTTVKRGVWEYTFTDTSGVNTAWYWDFGDGNTGIGGPIKRYDVPAPGRYTVTLIVENACGRDTFSQFIDATIGIEDDLFVQSIHLFPHPVQNVSYLQFDNPTRELYSLRILDLQGRLVQEYPATRTDQFEILRKDLATGIYVYELIGERSYFGKMVVR